MYIGTAKDVQSRKAELVELVAGGKQTDSQIRSAELDIVFGIADYVGGGAWMVTDAKSGIRSVALGNMPHASKFAQQIGIAFDIVGKQIGIKDDGTPKVARKSQITGKSETMYLLLGKLAHPWVREGFGLVVDETTKSYGCSNWFSGFTSNLWAPFVASVKKIATDKVCFQITEQSLENLKADSLSDDILEKLQSIKDQVFTTEEKLVDTLKEALEEEQAVKFQSAILKHTKTSDMKVKALELLKVIKILTIDKEEQSGNNVLEMEGRVSDFQGALAVSSYSGVGINIDTLINAPNKSLILRDALNKFAERKAKTKAAAVQAVAKNKDAEVIAKKYNEVDTQFALSVDVNVVSDDKVDETVAYLEAGRKNLLAKVEEIGNQIDALQNRLAQADKIESVKKSLIAMGIDDQTAKVLAIQSLSNEAVQKMLANGGEQNGRGSKKPKQNADSEDAK